MRFFFDTEFIERPCTIDLISIGMVAEDDRQLYIEISDFDESKASDWVKENVIAKLWSRQSHLIRQANEWSGIEGHFGGLMTKKEAAASIRRFVGEDKPEFWGYFEDYDWVVFCWLFGTMMDLLEGRPMFCRDIKQLAGDIRLPAQQDGNNHNALADAIWTRDSYNFIINKISGQ